MKFEEVSYGELFTFNNRLFLKRAYMHVQQISGENMEYIYSLLDKEVQLPDLCKSCKDLWRREKKGQYCWCWKGKQ